MNQLLLALAFTCAAVGCENRGATLPTDPKKIVVSDDTARGQFRSINEAVKAAAPGATILIRPGVYQESVVIDEPVELIADGGGEVAIEVFNLSCIMMSAERAKISGLKLRSVSGTFGTIVKYFLVKAPWAAHHLR